MRGMMILALAFGLACGDDDAMTMVDAGGGDTGASDGGTDAGVDAFTPPVDGGTDAGPPPACSPFTPDSCGPDAKCAVAIEFDADGEFLEVFYECVDGTAWADEGVRCRRSDIEVEGRIQTQIDNCNQGFFCTANDAGRSVCTQMCESGVTDCGTDGICLLANSEPEFGFCQTAENCDPVQQTGCGMDEACYVLGSTSGDIVGDCFEWTPLEGEDGLSGSPCMFIDQCAPGLRCTDNGDMTASCQEFCDASAEPDPETFMCTDPDECIAFEPEDGGSVRTPTPPGFCGEPEPAT